MSYPVGPRLAQSRAFQLLFGAAQKNHDQGRLFTRRHEDSDSVNSLDAAQSSARPRRMEPSCRPSVPLPVAPKLVDTKVLSISEYLPQTAVDAALNELRPAAAAAGEWQQQQQENPLPAAAENVEAFSIEHGASERLPAATAAASAIAESFLQVVSFSLSSSEIGSLSLRSASSSRNMTTKSFLFARLYAMREVD